MRIYLGFIPFKCTKRINTTQFIFDTLFASPEMKNEHTLDKLLAFQWGPEAERRRLERNRREKDTIQDIMVAILYLFIPNRIPAVTVPSNDDYPFC